MLGFGWDCFKREIDVIKFLFGVNDSLVVGDNFGFILEGWGDICWIGCGWVWGWGWCVYF